VGKGFRATKLFGETDTGQAVSLSVVAKGPRLTPLLGELLMILLFIYNYSQSAGES